MFQTERIWLAFFDNAKAHLQPRRNAPGSQMTVDPMERYSLGKSTPIISRTSLASVADYGTPLNIIRVFTCIEQPDWEVRLLLPLQEIFNFHGWPTQAPHWHPDSTSWKISTRTAHSGINCADSAEYFSIIYYCTNLTLSLNLSLQHSRSSYIRRI
jgi:hypothetical protein